MGLPQVVASQRNVSGIVSASTQHEPARCGLGFAPSVVVACPDLLAACLEVAAAGHGTLVLAVKVIEITVVIAHGLYRFDCTLDRQAKCEMTPCFDMAKLT